ncbi:hypothetical protein [Halostagnicola kamekurae]|uniref:C2H2-type domain-containing protein n=1 Tax=Halostagnicola kamekurae TaxID=619731 RepID=A0A1I6TGW0_9EURY|nr:hypothetical protein [Halostagnicola kamekurae]SFS88462.1 hypothetical protein SAMN04488556_3110 [Halostagnicola kamekurae]
MTPDTPDTGSLHTTGAETIAATPSEESHLAELRRDHDRPYSCPLCAFVDDSRQTVYEHLLSSHRKRAITTALFENHLDPQR